MVTMAAMRDLYLPHDKKVNVHGGALRARPPDRCLGRAHPRDPARRAGGAPRSEARRRGASASAAARRWRWRSSGREPAGRGLVRLAWPADRGRHPAYGSMRVDMRPICTPRPPPWVGPRRRCRRRPRRSRNRPCPSPPRRRSSSIAQHADVGARLAVEREPDRARVDGPARVPHLAEVGDVAAARWRGSGSGCADSSRASAIGSCCRLVRSLGSSALSRGRRASFPAGRLECAAAPAASAATRRARARSRSRVHSSVSSATPLRHVASARSR